MPGIDPAVLTPWDGFPIGARPRPIVLAGDAVAVAGFRSGDGKLAALTGRFALTAALPQAPATLQVRLPDGPATLPTLPAEKAYDLIRASASRRTHRTPRLPRCA
ncbi:MAG: hypothetical protein HOV79_12710 [Hamadaea sp.]|nr:hypothetical protein [Hamadaea sp.]